MDSILSAISTVGFPIAACIALGWFITKQLDKLIQAVDNNTKVTTELIAYLKREEGRKK